MRPVGGVEDADRVHDARPSVLYAGPFFLVRTYNDLFTAEICFESKMISKESISVYARRSAQFLEFRRFVPMPSDLPSDIAS